MSWLYVPGLPCCPKESGPHSSFLESVTEQSVTWSGKPLPPLSWSRLWKREPLIRRLSGVTCEPSTAQRGADAWISSLRASRARTSASQESGQDLTASAPASFSTSSTLPTIAVRGASLWRTSAPSLLPPPPLWTRPKGNLKNVRPPESWENWPTAGGTRSGSLFPRPMWAPATGGLDGSALRGDDNWTTPQAHDVTERGSGQQPTAKAGNACLARDSRLWLTPIVPNGGRSVPAELVASKGTTEEGDKRTVGLESQTKHWATPNAHDGRRPGADLKSTQGANLSRDAATWPAPNTMDGPHGARGISTNSRHQSANDLQAVVVQWPTPAARDHKGTDLPSRRGGGELESRDTDGGFLPLFAPGPADPRSAGIIAGWPWLAPATEPGVRMLVDGPPLLVDESRAHQLRQVGNGCVPLQAAAAFVLLVRRAQEIAA